jgi:hypothetical protein
MFLKGAPWPGLGRRKKSKPYGIPFLGEILSVPGITDVFFHRFMDGQENKD